MSDLLSVLSGWLLSDGDGEHTCGTRSRADVNAVVLEVEALSAVISLSLSHWSWQRRRQPNLNKSFIAE